MKIKVKSKAQLIKEGWVENKKSIYARLSIDGMGYNHNNVRYGKNKIGILSDFQVDAFLGKNCEVDSLYGYAEMPHIRVKGSYMGMIVEANLPYSCFEKLGKRQISKLEKDLTPIRLQNRFNRKDIDIVKAKNKITVGCQSTSFENLQKIFNELKRKGVVK